MDDAGSAQEAASVPIIVRSDIGVSSQIPGPTRAVSLCERDT